MRFLRIVVSLLLVASSLYIIMPEKIQAQGSGGVSQYCKNNSSDIQSVSLTVSRNQSEPDIVELSYTVNHITLPDDQNIGVFLYATNVINGSEQNFTEINFVDHLSGPSEQRRKITARSTSGLFTLFESSPDLVYKFVLLAISPADAGYSQQVVFGNEAAKNRCGNIVTFNSQYDTGKPPAPSGLQLGFDVPSSPEGSGIALSWHWEWTRSSTANFEIDYSTPDQSPSPISGPTITPDFFRTNITLPTKNGSNAFVLRAVVSGKKSVDSEQVSINFGSDGRFINYKIGDLTVTRDQVLAGDPVTGGDSTNEDTCSLTWIISGDGNWLNPFDDGAPEVLRRLNIDGKKLNPFSRMSVCLYLWTVYPITKWASGLIEDVGGIAVSSQKAKWHA